MLSRVVGGILLLSLAFAVVDAAHGLDAPTTQRTDLKDVLYLDLEKGGRVVIQMFPEYAPLHCARVKELARAGFYDGLTFHRVIPGFMAQGKKRVRLASAP